VTRQDATSNKSPKPGVTGASLSANEDHAQPGHFHTPSTHLTDAAHRSAAANAGPRRPAQNCDTSLSHHRTLRRGRLRPAGLTARQGGGGGGCKGKARPYTAQHAQRWLCGQRCWYGDMACAVCPGRPALQPPRHAPPPSPPPAEQRSPTSMRMAGSSYTNAGYLPGSRPRGLPCRCWMRAATLSRPPTSTGWAMLAARARPGVSCSHGTWTAA